MKNKIKICNITAYVLLTFLILSISPFVLPKIVGIQPYGILSNSMEPTLVTGSLVYVSTCSADEVEVNDIITFKLGVANANVATHRVVEKDEVLQQFITKGDHNENIDATGVSYDRLIGKVICHIPMLGSYYLWIVSAIGIACCSFGLCMIVLLWYYVGKWKKEERKLLKENQK